jgi:hypothetical protein
MKLEDGDVHHKKFDGRCMNSELEFQSYLNITHYREKVHILNIL